MHLYGPLTTHSLSTSCCTGKGCQTSIVQLCTRMGWTLPRCPWTGARRKAKPPVADETAGSSGLPTPLGVSVGATETTDDHSRLMEPFGPCGLALYRCTRQQEECTFVSSYKNVWNHQRKPCSEHVEVRTDTSHLKKVATVANVH